jgi:(2Fe-2S) ferredoxin
MITYRHHIFVCMNARPPGHPKGDCTGKGGRDAMAAFQEEMEKRGLWEKVGLNGCTCLGPCQLGPTVVVYPEGVWYGKVGPADVAEIMEKHILGGQPVERLFLKTLFDQSLAGGPPG